MRFEQATVGTVISVEAATELWWWY